MEEGDYICMYARSDSSRPRTDGAARGGEEAISVYRYYLPIREGWYSV